MKRLCLAAAAAAALGVPASAAGPSFLERHVRLSGLVGTRYLYAPSLNREGLEYLYAVNARVAAGVPRAGAALNATAASFDTRRYLKGFAGTGAGTMAAEPVFNFNRLFAEAYWKEPSWGAGARFGVQPIELPTLQLPLPLGQVGTYSGARVDVKAGKAWRAAALLGNLDTRRTQEVRHRLEAVGDRYNWLQAYAVHETGRTTASAGVVVYDSRFQGLRDSQATAIVELEARLEEGTVVPRLAAAQLPHRDRFAWAALSVESFFFRKRFSVRPGYLYFNRDARIVQLPNSNLFAPGRDIDNLFLVVQASLPRPSDMLYAAFTTGAKRFAAQRGSRFETGLILRFLPWPSVR